MAETPNLGTVVKNTKARQAIYGAYAVAAVIVGGIAAYYLGIQVPVPEPVIGAQAVIAYMAIPVGGLALANTRTE